MKLPLSPQLGSSKEIAGKVRNMECNDAKAGNKRRRKQRDAGARRILVDFVIGAHALANGCRLLTLDDRLYRSSFPTLAIETF